MFIFFQLLLGWLYGHFVEYFMHRWVFHNRKIFKSAFKYHYSQHHARSRRGVMLDVTTLRKPSVKDFEAMALLGGVLLHSPLILFVPYFFAMVCYSAIAYYLVHRRSHQDFEWARKHIPWHYDHHMSSESSKNWGVRSDIFDRLLGTRKVYKGLPVEIIKYRNYEFRGYYALRPHRDKRRRHKEIN